MLQQCVQDKMSNGENKVVLYEYSISKKFFDLHLLIQIEGKYPGQQDKILELMA